MKRIFLLFLLSIVSACGQTVTLKKNVGDTVTVAVKMETAEAHKFVGFDVSYPSAILTPVIASGNAVAFVEGDVYAGKTFETLCTLGNGVVVLSKVLKVGDPVVQSGTVATVLFVCKAHGTGTISLSNMLSGYVGSGGTVTKYVGTVQPVSVELQEPGGVVFEIEVR